MCFYSTASKYFFFLLGLVCGLGSLYLFTTEIELDVFNFSVWSQVLLHVLDYWLQGRFETFACFLVAILHCVQIGGAGYLLLKNGDKDEGSDGFLEDYDAIAR